MSVGQDLAQGADLTDGLECAGLDDREGLVEAHGLTLLQGAGVDVGRAGEAHLAAGGEHVDGVVVMRRQQHAITAGRLAQPVDLLAQGEQLLPRLLEGVHQLGVARRQGVDAGLELMDIAGGSQSAGCSDGVFELLAQRRRLLAQPLQFGGVLSRKWCAQILAKIL
jgi:hypothetical protein